jgi:GT2 family glycosyltransferase
MLSIKLFVACFPISVKKWFRQSPYLASLYSRNLQKSGLFYGFPSRKKLEVLYQSNIQQQDLKLQKLTHDNTRKHNFMVVVSKGKSKALSSTLKSILDNCEINNIWILCGPEALAKCRSVSKDFECKSALLAVAASSSEFESLSGSAFLLSAGDVVHGKLAAVINSLDATTVGISVTDIEAGGIDCFYCDTDQIINQKRVSPHFFPDWNPDLHLSTAYVKTALWIRDIRQVKEIDYLPGAEFIASVLAYLWSKKGTDFTIHHYPFVLVHRTIVTPFSYKDYAQNIMTFSDKLIEIEDVEDENKLSLAWPLVSQPLVSLVIPTKNGQELVKACIESILQKTTYQNFEILLIDNNSHDPAAIKYFKELNQHPKIRLLDYPFEFNYSAINNFAVSKAKGTIIGLVNNDIEVISPNWLSLMLGQVIRSDIGCVGAKLLYADGRIQHAGVVLGYGGGAGHAHKYFPRYHKGYLNRLGATGNYSSVTAACLLVKKDDYLAVNGLDEIAFKVAFNDVDFCLKVLGLGRRNLYCAEAELFHHESVSRGFDDTVEKKTRFDSELAVLRERWGVYIERDPSYNPNLTLRRENFSIKEESEVGFSSLKHIKR